MADIEGVVHSFITGPLISPRYRTELEPHGQIGEQTECVRKEGRGQWGRLSFFLLFGRALEDIARVLLATSLGL